MEEYLSCPFCGFSKNLKNLRLKPITIDPSDYELFSLRAVGAGPGRGYKVFKQGGFSRVEGFNIVQALEDPRFKDIAEEIRERFIQIIRGYISAGIVTLDDLS